MKKIYTILFLLFLFALSCYSVQAACPGYKKACWGDAMDMVKKALGISLNRPDNDVAVTFGADPGTVQAALFLDSDLTNTVGTIWGIDTRDIASYLGKTAFNRYRTAKGDLVVFCNGRLFCYVVYPQPGFDAVEQALNTKYGAPKTTNTYNFNEVYPSVKVNVRNTGGTKIISVGETDSGKATVAYFDQVVFDKIILAIYAKKNSDREKYIKKVKEQQQKEKNELDNL